MRRRVSACLFVAVAALTVAARDAHARYEGNLNLFAGTKWLRTADWEPIDQHRELGLMLAFGEERSAVHYSIDVLTSKADAPRSQVTPNETIVHGSSTELDIGIRKLWIVGATRPHLGGGAAAIDATQELSGPTGNSKRRDRSYGAWIEAGVTWRLAKHLNLGIDARYSAASVNLGSELDLREVAAGGIHVGALIGYGW